MGVDSVKPTRRLKSQDLLNPAGVVWDGRRSRQPRDLHYFAGARASEATQTLDQTSARVETTLAQIRAISNTLETAQQILSGMPNDCSIRHRMERKWRYSTECVISLRELPTLRH